MDNGSPSRQPVGAGTLYSIQFLRGVAAFLVVAFHLGIAGFGSGFVGVDVFFVISGFIMVYVTEGDSKAFLVKRLIRIVPLYWLGTTILLLAAAFLPNIRFPGGLDATCIVKCYFFIPTFVPGSGWIQPVLSVAWTLNYEMFFYLVFSVELVFSHKWRAEICTAGLVLVMLSGYLLRFPIDGFQGYYCNPILLEFIYGMALAKLYRSGRFQLGGTASVMLLIAACLLFAPIVSGASAASRQIYIGIPAAGLFAAFLLAENVFRDGAKIRAFSTWLGDLSYPVYLFHMFPRIILGAVLGCTLGVGWGIVSFAALIPLLYLLHRHVEKPLAGFLRAKLCPHP